MVPRACGSSGGRTFPQFARSSAGHRTQAPAPPATTPESLEITEVLFEQRQLQRERDGSLSDRFAPYDVHIYRIPLEGK